MKSHILKKISRLQETLEKHGQEHSAFLISLFLKYAGYDDEWREQINELAKHNENVFDTWFGNDDRIYIPFETESKIDNEVEKALSSLGYQIIDYIKGYAGKEGRQMKIGKIIAKAKRDAANDVDRLIQEARDAENEAQVQDHIKYREAIVKYWEGIETMFRDSEHRTHKDSREDLMIVFSKNPHDVAKMSYERGWSSCMELGKGVHFDSLMCEVAEGGFVAYLISANDKELKNPIARIHIRRFDNMKGKSMAKAETSVYGTDIAGFSEQVDKLLENLNSGLETGRYHLMGGYYSDTFYQDKVVIAPENEEELIEWFDEYYPESTLGTTYSLTDNYHFDLQALNYWKGNKHQWRFNDDGAKYFQSEDELNEFMRELFEFDPSERWIDLLIEEKYKSPTHNPLFKREEEEFLEETANKLRESRFDIGKTNQDYIIEYKEAAMNKIINLDRKSEEKGFSDEMYDTIEKTLKELYSSKYMQDDTSVLFFATYPERMEEDKFVNSPGYVKHNIMVKMLNEDYYEKYKDIWLKSYFEKLDRVENPDFSKFKVEDEFGETPYESNKYSSDVHELMFEFSNMPFYDAEAFDQLFFFIFKNSFPVKMKILKHMEKETPGMYKRYYGSSDPRYFALKFRKDLISTFLNCTTGKRTGLPISVKKDLVREAFPYLDLNTRGFSEITINNLGEHLIELKKDAAEFLPQIYKIIEKYSSRSIIDPYLEHQLVYIVKTIVNGKSPKDKNFMHDSTLKFKDLKEHEKKR